MNNDIKDFLDSISNDVLLKNEVIIDKTNNIFLKTIYTKKEPFEVDLGKVINPTKIFKREDGSYTVEIKFISNNKIESIMLDSEVIMSSKLIEKLGKYGYICNLNGIEKNYFRSLFVSLYSYLKDSSVAVRTQEQFGFDENFNFFIGERVIDKQTGIVNKVPVDDRLKDVAYKYAEKGDKKKFKDAINYLASKDEFNMHLCMFLLGISTPLLEIQGLGGIPFNFFSKHSGSCKTLTQYIARSFYGRHEDIIKDFTYLSVLNTAGKLRNFCVIIDEITSKLKNPILQEYIKLIIYNFSMGSTKSGSTMTGDLRKSYNYFSSVFITSNKSLSFVVDKNPAEMARFIDFEQKEKLTDSQVNDFINNIFFPIKENEGFGTEFLQVLVKNKEKIAIELKNKYDFISNEFNNPTARYIVNMFSCAIVTAQILNKIGYNIDVDKVQNFYLSYKQEIQEKIADTYLTADFIIEEFIQKTSKDILYVKKDDSSNKIVHIDDKQPRTCQAMINMTTGELRVPKRVFDDFLKTHKDIQATYKSVENLFKEENIYVEVKKSHINNANLTCYNIKLPHNSLGNVVFELINKEQEDEDNKVFELFSNKG